MIVGIPTEIKPDESRVAITPVGVEMLTEAGHRVLVQKGAGLASGIEDQDYARHGAEIVTGARGVWAAAKLIVKVKEPQPDEIRKIRPGRVLFAYFHLAASRSLTAALIDTGAACVAYETVEDEHGRLPLLEPMSEIAGRMAIQEAVKYLEKPMGGRGILIGGVPGVAPGHIMILGGGTVGAMAARVAAGLGASVAVLDIDLYRLRHLAEVMPPNVTLLHSNPHTIREQLAAADAMIGAVLIKGAPAPKLIRRTDLKRMKPGAVSRTSTFALTNATLPYVLKLAGLGLDRAAQADPGLAKGINIREGKLVCKAVGDAFGIPVVA